MPQVPAVRDLRMTPVAAPSVVVEALSRPARTFTGDFFVTHRAADRLWFALGDVAGKGLPAAIVMAMIQEELEHRIARCAETACDPAVTTRRVDEFLRPLLPSNRFATAVLGHLRDDGRLTITNAGHCPPLLVRNGGCVEAIPSTGPLLGILPNAEWRSVVTHLDPGETLVLYSDGLIEAQVGGDDLGIDGLRAHLATGDPRAILPQLDEVEDDLTLVVIRR
ncbi:MAG TPA: PP2C family protein-serine/threonine phosphatase [Thermoanaerobaculia bacterium]|nr:PP2C family protein-serine/threonine phosphatase [Thermoanaerobaculia bacterium]